MKITLQRKLVISFLGVVILVLAGSYFGGSMLIKNYFLSNKQHELTNKAQEMAKVVADYYDGKITHEQLRSFVNRVDSFLEARIWVVDDNLTIITISEEQLVNSTTSNRSGHMVKPSPMAPTPGVHHDPAFNASSLSSPPMMDKSMHMGANQQADDPSSFGPQAKQEPDKMMHGGGMMARMGMMHIGQGLQSSKSTTGKTERVAASEETVANKVQEREVSDSQIVLDIGQAAEKGEDDKSLSFADVAGMETIAQTVQDNRGQIWSKTYYHPYYEENMLIVAVPLEQSDGSVSGTVMIHAPIEEINGFLRQVYYYLGTAGVIAILCAMLIASYLSRGIVRPLKAMQETAAAMANGDYSVRIQTYLDDEIGAMGQSLNSLAHDLGIYVNKMEKVDTMRRDFVANVSHELRTPLTIMRGYNQAFRDGTISEPKLVAKYHAVMSEEINRLEHLITELLDLSQLQSQGIQLEVEQVSLAEIIANVITLVSQRSLEKGVTIIEEVPTDAPSVMGDGNRLTQLVLILVDNALKFTPADGRITCSLRVKEDSQTIRISDTGMGIGEEDLPYIWERFYKADKSRSSGGTGLGLAIAKQIVALHGGSLEVASELGKGTTFTVTVQCS